MRQLEERASIGLVKYYGYDTDYCPSIFCNEMADSYGLMEFANFCR
jgi:hypothetical protein